MHPPQNAYIEVPTPGPQKVTVFGERVFKDMTDYKRA
jgi:hypothetical protein